MGCYCLLWGTRPEKTIIQKDTCTPVFTAALFTIARTWKKPACPSVDKDNVVCIYNGVLAIKRNEIGSFVETWMDLKSVIQSEVSQKEKQIPYINACMWNLEKKMVQMNLFAEQE